MYLEERVQALEMQIELLQKQLESLQGAGEELFLTPKEAAQLMRCSVQTIYLKVQSGDIQADMSTGRARIPRSQFYRKKEIPKQPPLKRVKPEKPITGIEDIRKQMFGQERRITWKTLC